MSQPEGNGNVSHWADFITLLRESVLTQALVTLMALGAALALVLAGRSVPPELWNLNSLVIGFYFGGKVQAQAQRLMRTAQPGTGRGRLGTALRLRDASQTEGDDGDAAASA